MYEAAIKRASTGVYFAVPYMAKLIIEFMERIIKKKIAICENHAICSWNESYTGILPVGSIATTICSMLWRNTTRIGTNGMSVLPTTRASCANCLCRTRKWERLSRTLSAGRMLLSLVCVTSGRICSIVPRTRVAWQRFVRRTTSTCHAWHDSANWKTKCGRT